MSENKAVKTVSLIIVATAFSRILGFVRQQFLVAIYGESSALFMTPLRISQDFFELFLGAAVLGVFIPVYNSFEDEREKEHFANIFLNAVLLATGLLALAGIIFARQIIGFTGFDAESADIMTGLLRILFPMVIFMGAIYTFIGILQSKGEFLAPALVSAFSNCAIILYFVFLDRHFGLAGLSVVFVISWMVQLLTIVVPLIRKKYRYRFIVDLKNPALARSVKAALPITAGAWLVPVGMLAGIYFTSIFERDEFYATAFNISMNLFLLLTGLLAHGVCNYIFPKLAQSANSEHDFAEILKSGLSGLIFIMAPVACIAYVLRGEAFAVLFMRGEFTPELTAATADMFAPLAPAVVLFALIELLNRVFYSKNLAKFPMAAALAGICVNFALCYIFINVLGLAPAYITVASMACQGAAVIILIIALRSKIRGALNKKFLANIAKIVLSAGIMLIIISVLYLAIGNDAFVPGAAGLLRNIGVALAVSAAGLAAYIGVNFMLGTSEWRVMIKIIRKGAAKK